MTTTEELDRAIGQVRTALVILDQVHTFGKVNNEGMFNAPEDSASIKEARNRLDIAVNSMFSLDD